MAARHGDEDHNGLHDRDEVRLGADDGEQQENQE